MIKNKIDQARYIKKNQIDNSLDKTYNFSNNSIDHKDDDSLILNNKNLINNGIQKRIIFQNIKI